jgi:hypothetical protein
MQGWLRLWGGENSQLQGGHIVREFFGIRTHLHGEGVRIAFGARDDFDSDFPENAKRLSGIFSRNKTIPALRFAPARMTEKSYFFSFAISCASRMAFSS